MHAARAPLVVYGAFDRHNLGDLLFARVADALLGDETRSTPAWRSATCAPTAGCRSSRERGWPTCCRGGEVAALRRRMPEGHLAVQFSADFGDDATLDALAAGWRTAWRA